MLFNHFRYEDNRALFDMEENDLMNDLRDLPRNSAVRKVGSGIVDGYAAFIIYFPYPLCETFHFFVKAHFVLLAKATYVVVTHCV